MGKICTYECELDAERLPILVKESEIEYHEKFYSPSGIFVMLNQVFRLGYQAEEHVYLICMDAGDNVSGIFHLSQGWVNYSICRPREVYIRAMAVGAMNIIIAHNHTSGDVYLSPNDEEVLDRFIKTGKIMDIPLLDFIVVGRSDYYSCLEENRMT